MMTKPPITYFPSTGFRDSDYRRGPNYAKSMPKFGSRGSKLQAEGRARSMSGRPGAWNNYQPVSWTVPQEEMVPTLPPLGSQPPITPTPAGLTRRDILNIAKNNQIPISSYHTTLSDDALRQYVFGEVEMKTGRPVAWM